MRSIFLQAWRPRVALRIGAWMLLALGVAQVRPSGAQAGPGVAAGVARVARARALVGRADDALRQEGDGLVLRVGARVPQGQGGGLRWSPADDRLEARWARGGGGLQLQGAGVVVRVEREGAGAPRARGAVVEQEGTRGGSLWLGRGLEIEELVEIPAGESEQRYRIQVPPGFHLEQAAPGLVEVRDRRGVARLRMAAREAWGEAGERRVPGVSVRGDQVVVRADGGARGGVLDPSWASAGTMVLNRPSGQSILLPDSQLLFVGGDVLGSGVCELFDPETRLFSATGALNAPRNGPFLHRRGDGAIAVLGGEQPVAEGEVPAPVSLVELYDPVTRQFSGLAELDRPGAAFASLLDGGVLVVGGEGAASTKIDRLDPFTGQLSPAGTLLQGRQRASAVALPGGDVLIVGGGEQAFAEVFHPATGLGEESGALHQNLERPRLLVTSGGDVLVWGALVPERWSHKTGGFRKLGDVSPWNFHPLSTGQVLRTASINSSALLEIEEDRWFPLPLSSPFTQSMQFATLPTGHLLGTSGAQGDAVGSALLVRQDFGADRISSNESPDTGVNSVVLLPGGEILVAQDYPGPSLLLSPSLQPREALENPHPFLGGEFTRLASGRVLRTGGVEPGTGFPSAQTSIFDPGLRRWLQGPLLGALPSASTSGHRAVLLGDGRVLQVGGEAGNERQVTLWDEKTDKVSSDSFGLKVGRVGSTLTLLDDGRVLIFGGWVDMAPAEIFDPQTGQTAQVGLAQEPRFLHTATLLPGGDVLIVGGLKLNTVPEFPVAQQALRFSPTTQESLPLVLPQDRARHTATRLKDGRVLLAGGLQYVDGYPDDRAPALIFDPATNEFTPTPDQPTIALFNHTATVLPDQRVLLLGDDVWSPFSPISGVFLEVFDPATGLFSLPGLDPPLLPINAASAVMPSGHLLFAGGGGDGDPGAGLLRLEPSTGAVELLPTLLDPPRSQASALLLEDGAVLLAGGRGKGGAPLPDLTRYEPSTQKLAAQGPLSEGVARPVALRMSSRSVLVAGGEGGTLHRHDPTQGSTTSQGQALKRVGVAGVRLTGGDALLLGGTSDGTPSLPIEQVQASSFQVTTRATQPLGPWAQALPLPGDGALLLGENYIATLFPGGGLQFLGGLGFESRGVILPDGDLLVLDQLSSSQTRLFSPTGAPLGPWRGLSLAWVPKAETSHLHVLPRGELFFGATRPVIRELLPRGVARPLLHGAPPTLTPGATVSLQGARFRRMSAVGAGYTGEIADRHPGVMFRVEGGAPRFARVLSSADEQLSFEVPRSAFPGPGWLHVVVDGIPSEGVFTRLLPASLGLACQLPSECESGACVEGVCCDTPCEGVCTSCRAALQGPGGEDGLCKPIAAGLDPENVCEEDGLECGKTGVCDGAGQCQIAPKGTPCFGGGTCDQGACLAPLPAVCDGDGQTLVLPDGLRQECSPYTCQGAACRKDCDQDGDCVGGWWCSAARDCRSCEGDGVQVGGVTLSCAPYGCDRGACRASCENDQGCSEGYRCAGGVCGPYCSDDGGRLLSPEGSVECAPYRCLQGACAASCVTNLECAPGLLCGSDGRCRAPAVVGSTGEGGCSLGGGGTSGAWLSWVLLLAARRRGGGRRAARAPSPGRSRRGPPRGATTLLAAALTCGGAARGADPPPPGALEAAKEEFRKGVVLFEAGDLEVALDHFRRSRALFPSHKNTINMAVSLDRLGRHDEALELFEEVLTRFNADLSPEERREVPALMAAMRAKVGEIEVSSSTNGELYIDGRRRAQLPLSTPLRLLAGQRRVRILKDGYEPFEAEVEIRQGERARLDAVLRGLTSAGRLRVEQETLAGAEVFVDGARVGELPWEGTLAPGPHVVQVLQDRTGSAPTLATVLQGQTTLLRLRVGPLAAPVRLQASLPSAAIKLGDLTLGRGAWEGRLPEGSHAISASEEGYRVASLRLDLPRGSDAPIVLSLERDPDHPRWPRPPSLRPWFSAELAGVLGASLGSGAETSCGAGCSRGLPRGAAALLALGFELPIGFSVDLRGGYLGASSTVERRLQRPIFSGAESWAVEYDLTQDPSLRGPFLALGASRAVSFGDRWSFRGALALGLLFATSEDRSRGTATSGASRAALAIPGGDARLTSSPLLALASLGVERRIGPFTLLGSLHALFVTAPGPVYERGAVQVSPSCSPTDPSAVGCTPEAILLPDQRAHGSFALLLPAIGLRYTLGGSAP